MVVVHAVHVALDDSLHLSFHLVERVLRHGVEHVVTEDGIGAIAEGMGDTFSVEVDGVVAFDELITVGFGNPLHGNCLVGWGVEHILSECQVRAVVTEVVEDGRHDVGLLHDALCVVAMKCGIGRGIENDGHTGMAEGGGEERVVVTTGVVGCDDEDGVAEPFLLACLAEEETQGVVAIGNAFLDRFHALREFSYVAFWQRIRSMARCREDSRHERLFHFVHAVAKELKKLLIVDGPCTIEILVTIVVRVLVVFRSSVVALETGGMGKSLEAHRTVLCTMEECRGVALMLGKFACQSRHAVERCRCEEKRFHVVGQTGQH